MYTSAGRTGKINLQANSVSSPRGNVENLHLIIANTKTLVRKENF